MAGNNGEVVGIVLIVKMSDIMTAIKRPFNVSNSDYNELY